jgi:hypothetical protein
MHCPCRVLSIAACRPRLLQLDFYRPGVPLPVRILRPQPRQAEGSLRSIPLVLEEIKSI